MAKNGFEGKLGEEYELLLKAIPHYTALEESAGLTLRRNLQDITRDRLKVVEIGCGTGITTPYILEADSRISLTCIDNERIMIDQAKKRTYSTENRNKIRFLVRDAQEYFKSLPQNSLDAVVSAWVLHNIPEDIRSELLQDIYRSLRIGGIFVNADKIAQDGKEHERQLKWQLDRLKVYDTIGRSDYRAEWEAHYKFDNQPGIIWRKSRLISDLSTAGFKVIQKTFRKHMEATYVAKK